METTSVKVKEISYQPIDILAICNHLLAEEITVKKYEGDGMYKCLIWKPLPNVLVVGWSFNDWEERTFTAGQEAQALELYEKLFRTVL